MAKKEIRQWIAVYEAAYRRLDGEQVRTMNPASTFRPAQYNSVDVDFSNVDIRPREDGQTAVLHADVQYNYGFKRGPPQTPSAQVVWRMRRTSSGWVVEK